MRQCGLLLFLRGRRAHDVVSGRDELTAMNQCRIRFSGEPDCVTNRSVPDDCCPAEPLNRMNCVAYPPPSTKWGKNSSAFVGEATSSIGGVVVMKKSFRSL